MADRGRLSICMSSIDLRVSLMLSVVTRACGFTRTGSTLWVMVKEPSRSGFRGFLFVSLSKENKPWFLFFGEHMLMFGLSEPGLRPRRLGET